MLSNLVSAIKYVFQKYPVLISWLVNGGVALALRFGVHVTTDQVIALYGAVVTFLSLYLHVNTVSVGRIQGRK